MTSVPSDPDHPDLGVQEYRMHVSQRYLDLTRKKLELARLPRDLSDDEDVADDRRGVTKAELEPLLDHWYRIESMLEHFDFRAQEANLNRQIPQFRTTLTWSRDAPDATDQSLRVHFVHRKSTHQDAIPLLFCHDWGTSFIELSRVIESLCEPITTPTQQQTRHQPFHLICPSIPGFGFGDAISDHRTGIEDTASVFASLMDKLGYKEYMACGAGWGFRIARAISQKHPLNCRALFASNPLVPAPTWRRNPLSWLQYHLARLTRARIPALDFGFVPSDFDLVTSGRVKVGAVSVPAGGNLQSAFALADSPTGLLAFMLQMINPVHSSPSTTPDTQRNDSVMSNSLLHPWSVPDILTWTMMYWLSGPEAPLRWLRNARRETLPGSPFWARPSLVPLGVSFFRCHQSVPAHTKVLCPPMWSAAYCNLTWLRRHDARREVKWPAWEASDTLVLDLREYALSLKQAGLFSAPAPMQQQGTDKKRKFCSLL